MLGFQLSQVDIFLLKEDRVMKRKLSVFILAVCCLLLSAGASESADITNPILKKLVEKGILSEEEAVSVMQDMGKETAEKDKKTEEKMEMKAAGAAPEETKDLEKVAKALKGFKFSGLWYLSYQYGKTGSTSTTGASVFNSFNVKRGYLTVEKELTPWFKARLTTDVTTVNLSTSLPSGSNVSLNESGSLAVRIKYLYALLSAPDIAFLSKPNAEVGIVHTPWLDFEEHVNYYRLQDTMFIERNGITSSADYGITFATLLGGSVDENYQRTVNSAYPGRYGSVQAGVYNGGGYAASEQNRNKVLEGRVTVRPLPDIVPGLQLSYFGLTGKGNTNKNLDWSANLGFVSFEHEYFVMTGQYYWGKGNQSGSDDNNKRGYSAFAELKPVKKFSIIGRFDHFDPNKDVSNDDNNRYIAGVAYHIDRQHNNMVLLDYDTVDYKQPGKAHDDRVQLTWQVAF
jgi:polyhydroxyalkanoate synthesis regulator phasin